MRQILRWVIYTVKKKKESACSRFLSILIRNKFQMLLKKQSRTKLFICTRVFWWVALKICTTEKYRHARRWKIFWFSLNSNTPLPQEERINEEHSRLLQTTVGYCHPVTWSSNWGSPSSPMGKRDLSLSLKVHRGDSKTAEQTNGDPSAMPRTHVKRSQMCGNPSTQQGDGRQRGNWVDAQEWVQQQK